jgi:hypothetical protein
VKVDGCPYDIRKVKDYVVRQVHGLVQADSGSEVQVAFEEECQRQSIKLFVLPPRSPKLDDCIERTWWKHEEMNAYVTDVLDEHMVCSLTQNLVSF